MLILLILSWGLWSGAQVKKSWPRYAPSYDTLAKFLQKNKKWNFKKKRIDKDKSRNNRTVRVLLRSWPISQQNCAKITSMKGFWLATAQRDMPRLSLNDNAITIASHGSRVYIQGKRVLPDNFYIIPKEGCITFEGKQYKGMIRIAQESDNLFIINCVDLEDYICSVLGTESWPGWPVEVNKVFAIASRSYVLSMMQQENKRNNLYHVCDTNVHQTYAGEHTSETIRKAVEQTEGFFLSYDNKPILAMFDSCCGGLVPAYIEDFDFSKAPYLKRHYACRHCKRCKIYQWNAEYSCGELERLLKLTVPKLSSVRTMRVKKKDKAGIVQEVVLDPGNHIISGKKLYSLLKPLKSFCFAIKKKNNKIYFEGKGFGHHIGLCQWGAREMVRDGWDYKRILRFYYPGTKLAQLT